MNQVYLENLDPSVERPTVKTPPDEMKEWIFAKYADKKWVKNDNQNVEELSLGLMNSITEGDITRAFYYLTCGADCNYIFGMDHESRSPIHEAINLVDFPMTVMLLENGKSSNELAN